MAVKVSKSDKPKSARKTFKKSSAKPPKKKKSLRDFYGALKDIYGKEDGLAYQKKIRDEW